MDVNLIKFMKTPSNNLKTDRNINKTSSDSKFDEILNKSIDSKEHTSKKDIKPEKDTAKIESKEDKIESKDGKIESKEDKIESKEDKIESKEDKIESEEVKAGDEVKNQPKDGSEESPKVEVDDKALQELLASLNSIMMNIDNSQIPDSEKAIKIMDTLSALKSSGNLELLKSFTGDSKLQDLISKMMNPDGAVDLKDILSKLQAMLGGENKNLLKSELSSIRKALEEVAGHNDQESSAGNVVINQELQGIKSSNNEAKSDSAESSLDNSSTSKDEKVLKSILGDSDGGSNKAVSMAAHLNRLRQDNDIVVDKTNIPVVNRNTFNADIIKAVKFMDTNNIKELTVNVAPRELGQITIRITMEAGVMKANISASSKETLSILNSNLADLKNSLSNSEIKVQNVSVNIYNDDTTFFSNSFGNRNESFNGNGQGGRQESKAFIEDVKETKDEKNSSVIESNISALA